MDKRLTELKSWLQTACGFRDVSLYALAGDASYRRYFRLQAAAQTFIIMDAPPQKESCDAFVLLARTWRQAGISVPDIVYEDRAKGFLVLSDFGDQTYLSVLHDKNADQLYQRAIDELIKIQLCGQAQRIAVPQFDAVFMGLELQRFIDWYIKALHQIELSSADERSLKAVFDHVIEQALAQPQVLVHRDYHSRNLMYLSDNRLGVLDFQDAVWGPITYDLISLLKDCYIRWPRDRVLQWVACFYKQLCQKALLQDVRLSQFIQWFDYVGVQRHLKVIGIFARLSLRDGKSHYLQDIPLALTYLHEMTTAYPALEGLQQFFRKHV